MYCSPLMLARGDDCEKNATHSLKFLSYSTIFYKKVVLSLCDNCRDFRKAGMANKAMPVE
jgi:hypothetical protein